MLLVDDATMSALNSSYRGVNGPTDVLAFPMVEGRFGDISPDLLGDVVISTETARRHALATGAELREELALLLVHGILHLVGYDHATTLDRRKMWRRQRLILTACGIRMPVGGPLAVKPRCDSKTRLPGALGGEA